MFNFRHRRVIKQGGSCLVSLPMQWVKSFDVEFEEVQVDLDIDNTLRIAPVKPTRTETCETSTSMGDVDAPVVNG